MTVWINTVDGALHDDMDGAALSLPSWPQGLVAATAEQIAAAKTSSKNDLWDATKEVARTTLAASDNTLMRCYEAGIPLPPEWVEYRKTLRAIISAQSGDPTQPLPERPDYPKGT